MNQRRRVRGLFAALIVTALLLVTLDFRSDVGGPTDVARGAVTSGVAPFERSLAAVLGPVRRLNDTVRDLVQIRAENRRLRTENLELAERRRAFADLQRELTEVRALLGLRDESELTAVAARVIAVSPSNFEWTVSIDVGERDGVVRGMAVISSSGLVGRILQTTPTASKVLLVIDPNFSVAARSVSSAGVGVLDGQGGDPLRFSPLDARVELRDGDEVVTATFAGSAIPAGIPIGLVAARDESSSRLTSAYAVRPFVDVTTLDHVLVVLAAPFATLPPLEDTDGITFVRPPIAPALPPGEVEDGTEDAVEGDDAGGGSR
jgi:rod shape-determining protein MreC